MELIVLAGLCGGGFFLYRFVSADRGGLDLAWTTGRRVGAAADTSVAAYRPDTTPPPVRTAVALSRAEARRLWASPLLWVGGALTVLFCLIALDTGIGDQDEWLSYGGRFLVLLLYPLAGMVLIAANRAALRARRDGTVELFDTLPARPSTRTAAVFLALRAPALFGAAMTAVLAFCAWWGAGKAGPAPLWDRSEMHLPFALMGLATIVGAMVIVVCGGALGVALARLLPWGLVPVASLVAVALITAAANADELPAWVGTLSPWWGPPSLPSFLAPFPAAWHVVYLVGLGLLAVGAAFLLDRDRRWGGRWLGAAACLILVALVGQGRTFAGDTADRVADLVTDPAAHQTCVENGSARVCAYPSLAELGEGWLALAGGVRAAAPAAALDGPIEVHQRLSPDEIAQLPPPVRDEVARRGGAFDWEGDPGLHPDLRWGGDDGGPFRALLVAHELVGLPEPGAEPVLCYAGGQARAAVAVALAGRATLDAGRSYRAPAAGGALPFDGQEFDDPRLTTLREDAWEVDSEPAVVYTESDLAVGRALLARPGDEVRRRLAADWDRWVDPATPTTALAAAFGLGAGEPAPAPDGVAPCR